MKDEQYLREWRLELRDSESTSVQQAQSTKTVLDALDFLLEDTPPKDYDRILALVVDRIGEEPIGDWMRQYPVDYRGANVSPFDLIIAGEADRLLAVIPTVPTDWKAA